MRHPSALRSKQLAFAVAEFNAGRIAAAQNICMALLAETPNEAAVNQLMATIALRLGRVQEADRYVTVSLASRQSHAPTWGLGGDIARATGDLQLAAMRLAKAVALDPSRPEFSFAFCRVRIELANEGQSNVDEQPDFRQLVAQLVAKFPDFAPGWTALAAELEKAGQGEAAFLAQARLAMISPNVANYVRLAQSALSLGRMEDAIDAFRRALGLDPTMAAVWFKLGVALQDNREPAAAVEAYDQALRLDPRIAEAAANLGIALQEVGDLAGAKQAYGKAIRLRPNSFGRIAQALTAAPKGELWLDLGALKTHLLEQADWIR